MSKLSTIFGEPNTGIHSYRLFDIAIVDVLLTILAGYLIAKVFKISLFVTLVGLFVTGIIIHRVLGVRTKIDRLLFP